MNKKEQLELIIGGDYTAQPEHKRKIIPKDFLQQFYNVNPNDLNDIIKFANNYGFSGYIVPDIHNSIIDKFSKIQSKYRSMIEDLLIKEKINYSDIDIINKDLESSKPHIALRDTVNDLEKIKRGFAFYDLKSVNGEESEYEIKHMGAFDADQEGSAHIQIKIKVPTDSKTKWYIDRVDDGILVLKKIFPEEDWIVNEQYLKNVVLKNGKIEFDSENQPTSIEMNLYLGKTDFSKEELVAVWTSFSAESFLAKRIWDYINSEYIGMEYKLCKICTKIHKGRSQDYCPKEACRKEWDNIRKKRKKK